MKTASKIFVDADAFVALANPADSNNSQAIFFAKVITQNSFQLITSDPAFGEAITIIRQETSLKTAIEFTERILTDPILIIEVDSSLRRQALDIFKNQSSKNSRFTDCVNMAIMKNENLDTIFSFDEHYKKNGFKRFGVDK